MSTNRLKRIYCPICGEWHDGEEKEFDHDSIENLYKYKCNNTSIAIWFEMDYGHGTFFVRTDLICDKINYPIHLNIELDECKYDQTECTIEIPFRFYADVDVTKCKNCRYIKHCNFIKINEGSARKYLKIKLQFENEGI